jgi:phosphoglycolate phosphatase-like HAD superfamily hydrolase
MGLDGLITTIACGEAAKKGKPAPGINAVALEALGAAPDDAVMVGGTPSDARAASAIGVACVGLLTGGFSSEELRHAGCTATASDISALSVVLDFASVAGTGRRNGSVSARLR